jgi:hypothetical protein
VNQAFLAIDLSKEALATSDLSAVFGVVRRLSVR